MKYAARHDPEAEIALARAATVSKKKVFVNALANYGYYALQAIILLVLQAYIIRSVGKAEYSLWPLCRVCISISALIQLGIGSGASRFIAHALGKKDVTQIHRITSSLFVALVAGALLYLGFFIYVGCNFEVLFDIPAGTKGIAMPTMCLLGLAGAVLMPFSVFEGTLVAAQERVRLNTIRSVLLIVRLILVVAAFEFYRPTIAWVAATQLLLSVAEACALYRVAGNVFPWRRIRIRDCHWDTFRKINSFSLLTLVSAVAGKLYWDADKVIINKLLDPTFVVGYAVVVTLLMQSLQITRLTSTAFISPLTILFARGQLDRIARILYRSNRVSVPVGGIAVLFFTFYGDEFVKAYIGEEFRECTGLFYVLGPALLLSQTQTLSARIPAVCGHARLPALCAITAAVANALVSLVLVKYFNLGLTGIAVATVIVLLAYRLVFTTWYASHLLHLNFASFASRLVGVPLLHCMPAFLILPVCRIWITGQTWIELACVLFVASITQCVFTYRYGLLASDRLAFRTFVMKFRKRNMQSVGYFSKSENTGVSVEHSNAKIVARS